MPKRKELYEVKDELSGEIVETMAVSEEQAIRNVTYNNGEMNYEEYNVIENYTAQKKIPDYIYNLNTVLSTYNTWKIDEFFNLFPELKEKY